MCLSRKVIGNGRQKRELTEQEILFRSDILSVFENGLNLIWTLPLETNEFDESLSCSIQLYLAVLHENAIQ